MRRLFTLLAVSSLPVILAASTVEKSATENAIRYIVEDIDAEIVYQNEEWVFVTDMIDSLQLKFVDERDLDQNKDIIRVHTGERATLLSLLTGEILEGNFDRLETPTDYMGSIDFVMVEKGEKWGVIDAFGIEMIPMVYDYLEPINSDGLFRAGKGLSWGMVNMSGQEVFPAEFDFVQQVDSKLYKVKKDGREALISTNNQLLTEFEYFDISEFKSGYARVAKKSKSGEFIYGLIDKAGNLVVDVKYEKLILQKGGQVKVKSGLNWFTMSTNELAKRSN